MASAAVVPCPPTVSIPISSKICATESPIAGVGASERSTMPNCAFKRFAASLATSCPARVILNAVRLIISATSVKSAFGICSSACLTTPGPDTPTLITASASPMPWNAPAINGLSSTALQNATSFAAPIPSLSVVSSAHSLNTSPSIFTASILMPVFVEPTLTDAQRRSVVASTSGMVRINMRSYSAVDFCTSAEYPPRKSMPSVFAALSSALPIKGALWGKFAEMTLTGVTDTRLLTMGIPNSPESVSAVFTMFSARLQTRSYTLFAVSSALSRTQERSESPIVMVRMSRCSFSTIAIVSKTSLLVNIFYLAVLFHPFYTLCMALKISSCCI